MRKLTFLLPIKDRPDYTRTWLKHNIRPEYEYLVADGSLGDENEEIFRENQLPNLAYVRFQKDLSVESYIEKMQQAASKIRTEYVMTCDNDDFINFRGIDSCLAKLEGDSGLICAGGPIYGVVQEPTVSVSPRYTLPVKVLDAIALNNRSGFDALSHLFAGYRYMWYSIFRTGSYQSIWNGIRQLHLSNVFLVEILQTELAFCHGKYGHVNANHYIRLLNPATNSAKELGQGQPSHVHNIYFDDEYRQQVIKAHEYVAAELKVALPRLLEELKNYYIAGVAEKSQSLSSRNWSRVMRIHEIIPRRLGVYFSIEAGIRWVNIFRRPAA